MSQVKHIAKDDGLTLCGVDQSRVLLTTVVADITCRSCVRSFSRFLPTRTCSTCKIEKPLDDEHFASFKSHRSQRRFRSWCKPCENERMKQWRKLRPELVVKSSRMYHANLRLGALKHYSNGTMTCACCSESEVLFLCLDHINGGGNAHRRSLREPGSGFHLYRWLKDQGYPLGFQVLCYNCNMAKHLLGK